MERAGPITQGCYEAIMQNAYDTGVFSDSETSQPLLRERRRLKWEQTTFFSVTSWHSRLFPRWPGEAEASAASVPPLPGRVKSAPFHPLVWSARGELLGCPDLAAGQPVRQGTSPLMPKLLQLLLSEAPSSQQNKRNLCLTLAFNPLLPTY